MHSHDISRWSHQHHYAKGHERESERRTAWVVALTAVMMVAEITAGWLFNSMALLADGWHMATHTLALGVGVYAYRYARIHANNPVYSFGTGKVHALGGYTSALFLGAVAIMVLIESVAGIFNPKAIHYNEALIVAVVGLLVNIASVMLLGGGGHRHDHDHDHDHDHEPHAHTHDDDINHKAALAHVVVDAMTSIFAIIALLVGKYFGLAVVDPIVGIVGAVVIGKWSITLMKTAVQPLLDRQSSPALLADIRTAIESDGDSKIVDLHVWQVAPGTHAAIISLVADNPHSADAYKARLETLKLAHVTIERNQCPMHT